MTFKDLYNMCLLPEEEGAIACTNKVSRGWPSRPQRADPFPPQDLLPTPPEERTWSHWDYVATWTGPSFDINQWVSPLLAITLPCSRRSQNTGSSFISVGLTVVQAVCPVIIGSLISACAITSMGSWGSRYGIGFPSLARPTFGVGGLSTSLSRSRRR